jgi:enoyl-CoA hydratase/carnithine racemase
VNHVVSQERLLEKAVQLAEKLAAVHRPAMAETKRLFHQVADLPFEAAIERGREANVRMRGLKKQ